MKLRIALLAIFLSVTVNLSAVPVLVQVKSASAAGATQVTVTMDTPTTAGNLLVAVFTAVSSTQMVIQSNPTGFIFVASSSMSANTNDTIILADVNAPSTTSVTFEVLLGSAGLIATVFEVSGMQKTEPIDRTATSSGTSATFLTGTTELTTRNNEFVVYGYTTAREAGVAAWSGSAIEVTDINLGAGYGGGGAAYEIITVGRIVSGSATYTGSAEYTGAVATFKAISTEGPNINPMIMSSD